MLHLSFTCECMQCIRVTALGRAMLLRHLTWCDDTAVPRNNMRCGRQYEPFPIHMVSACAASE